MAQLIPIFLNEIQQEAKTTRKMLQLVPDNKLDWQPHPKSMTMKQLATHIAEIPEWAELALKTEGIDFAAGPYEPAEVNQNADLLAIFEQSLSKAQAALNEAQETDLDGTWTMRSGDQVLASLSKGDTIRHSLSQTIHHRAQLGVYLRLLDIPIPGTYGPCADDNSF